MKTLLARALRAARSAAWRRLLTQAVLLLACHAGARAQDEPRPGTRLRVETSVERHTGTLVRRSADSLFLRAIGTDHAIAIRDILYARESLGRTPRSALVVKRGLQGGAGGALIGAVFLGLVMDGRTDAGPTLFGATVGSATGALLGLLERQEERWRVIEVVPGSP
jgi:hypothetical protein